MKKFNLLFLTVLVSLGLSAQPLTFNFDNNKSDLIQSTPGGCDMYIAGVIDGPLPGGTPKAVQLCATAAIADLSIYGIGSANNGGGTDGEEFTFPADALAAGDCIWVSTEALPFADFFGFSPCYIDDFSVAINGDDAVELFCSGAVIDVFGDINVDGTGQCWEHLDGWAVNNNTIGNNGVFDCADWTFSGIDALDGETTNASAANPYPNAVANCPSVIALCNISNIVVTTAAACNGDDVVFTVTFDAENASGDYSLGGPGVGGIGELLAGPGTGTGLTITGTITGPTMAQTISVNVRDINEISCSTMNIDIDIPDCPTGGGGCFAEAPEFTVVGDCASGDANGDGMETPFTWTANGGSTNPDEITEYLVLGAADTIRHVVEDLGVAAILANDSILLGGTYCIQAITHSQIEFQALVDAIDTELLAASGGLISLCGLLPNCPYNTLSDFYTDVQALATLTVDDVEALIGFGQGGMIDIGALVGIPGIIIDIPTFCYDLSTEVCATNSACPIAVDADLVINEIYYNPCTTQGDDSDFEFVEIYNYGQDAVDLTDFSFDGLSFTFPAGSMIAAGEYIIVAINAASYAGGGYQVFEWTSGGLNNGGETIILYDPAGIVVDSFAYDPALFPTTNGDCNSIELIPGLIDNDEPGNLQASFVANGTPGAINSSPGGCVPATATIATDCAGSTTEFIIVVTITDFGTATEVGNFSGTNIQTLVAGTEVYTFGPYPNGTLESIVINDLDDLCDIEFTDITEDCSVPLPVQLLDFNARAVNCSVELNWTTLTEINSASFLIQHSTNGDDFTTISTMEASGNSHDIKTYSFSHNAANRGINYYRIIQLDFDGDADIFPIVASELNCENVGLNEVYPNPTKATVNLVLNSSVETAVQIDLVDLNGKTLLNKTAALQIGQNNLQISLAQFATGLYFVRIIDGQSNIVTVQKVEKY